LNQGKKAVTHEGFVMVNRANDSWGTVTRSPPVYYITTDAPVLAVSSTKEAMDLAIDAWGNFLGSSFKCNTQSPLGIGCCDGHTKQAPQQRGPWRDISRA
jgi:hypothetical protein